MGLLEAAVATGPVVLDASDNWPSTNPNLSVEAFRSRSHRVHAPTMLHAST